MSEQTYKLSIKGMHCRSCELLVEDYLKELENVSKVEVNHSTGEAIIHYTGHRPSEAALQAAVIKAGYETGKEGAKPLFNFNTDNLLEIIIGSGILFLFYIVLKSLGLTSIDFNPDSSESGMGVALLVGLVAGVSTCMALVGGLVLGLSSKFNDKHPTATRTESFRPHLFFVGGRILGYAFLGGILGMLGSVFELSSGMNATLTMLVGALMLFIGLQLTGLFPRLSAMSFTLPTSVAKLFGVNKKQREYSHKHAAALGALTFFLPCGFTQAMQVFAVSRGSFLDGAIIMGLFAFGTAPGLLSIGGLTASVKGSARNLFFKTAGVAIVLLSLFNLNNGYSLLAAGLDFSGGTAENTKEAVNDPNVTLENGVQVVRMIEHNTGYSPNRFTIKRGVPVKWIVDAQAPYSCASVLGIPKLKIQKFLKAGENIIEFTPTETGTLKFSCSMGMYTGAFIVVDDDSSATDSVNDITATDSSSDNPAVVNGGATCGSGGCGCGGGAAGKTAVTGAVKTEDSVQVLNTVYTASTDISPNEFTVNVNQPVKFVVKAEDDGAGCMNYIKVGGLANEPQLLEAGKTLTFEFTPTEPGEYPVTCAMGMQRGTITVK